MLKKSIRRRAAVIPLLREMLMIQPVLSKVHIRRMKGMTAPKLHTAHWFWTQKLTTSL
jgi:hypothetical protein